MGADLYGDFIRSTLDSCGVDTTGLVRTNTAPTTFSVVCIQPEGQRSFLYTPGSTAELCPEDIPWETVEQCGIVFVTSTLLLDGLDGAPCAEFLARCRAAGKYTVMDTSWDMEDIWLPKIRESLQGLDLFLPSYDEAEKLSGEQEPEKMTAFFHSLGVREVIIKLGAKGAFWQPAEGAGRYFPTYDRIKPVDTTGAGDSFCAGILAGLSMGWPMERCIPFANAVGTHCIMEMGASAGIRPMEEILRFMEEYEKERIPS